jgi:RNA polymerase sigma-70 factor (ECF subfamily)
VDQPIPELLERVKRGDVDAFAPIVAHFRTEFGRYARHMVGNREDAEDAVQETFVRAYRSLTSCRDPHRFGAWAFRILVNRCRTVRRRSAGRARLEITTDFVPEPERGASADDSAWREEIDRALVLLPADQREAFLLHHVEGYSYDEMAGLTGTGVSALKMRVKRACDRLRTELEGVRHG